VAVLRHRDIVTDFARAEKTKTAYERRSYLGFGVAIIPTRIPEEPFFS
jgi:hypothetical protein